MITIGTTVTAIAVDSPEGDPGLQEVSNNSKIVVNIERVFVFIVNLKTGFRDKPFPFLSHVRIKILPQ